MHSLSAVEIQDPWCTKSSLSVLVAIFLALCLTDSLNLSLEENNRQIDGPQALAIELVCNVTAPSTSEVSYFNHARGLTPRRLANCLMDCQSAFPDSSRPTLFWQKGLIFFSLRLAIKLF
jgi:hypothetical protein